MERDLALDFTWFKTNVSTDLGTTLAQHLFKYKIIIGVILTPLRKKDTSESIDGQMKV